LCKVQINAALDGGHTQLGNLVLGKIELIQSQLLWFYFTLHFIYLNKLVVQQIVQGIIKDDKLLWYLLVILISIVRVDLALGELRLGWFFLLLVKECGLEKVQDVEAVRGEF
jgi:hypothetical protein